MTRINCVHPSLLVRQHLVAEYRELPRIYKYVRDAVARGETPAHALSLSSPNYTLNKGHCRFFYTRLGWLSERYRALIEEMLLRGYAPAWRDVPDVARTIPPEWFGTWEPTPACVAVNVERINERLRGMGLADNQIVL